MATIKDVAALAGISTTTVSIIINGRAEEKGISGATVEKVRKAMAELNYRPDQNARRLRSLSLRRPLLCFFWPLDYRAFLLGTFITSLTRALILNAFNAELRIENYAPGELSKQTDSLKNSMYDGIIIGGTNQADLDVLETVTSTSPIVMLNRASKKHHSVSIDNRLIGMQAASLIRRKGYTECGLIRNTADYYGMTERTQFFMESCGLLGIDIRDEWVVSDTGNAEGGARAAEKLLENKDLPPVLFCEDDFMAQGVLVPFHEHGIRIPEDMELLAFGMQADESMDYLIPSISTLSLPYQEMANLCIKILQDVITDKKTERQELTVEPVKKLRKSFSEPA